MEKSNFLSLGHLPDGRGHENAGPARDGWFGDIKLPDKDQWFYQAVSDVIRANSLLRSFPEINKDKIGLTGISWGGTIVSTVAGVDSRFAFVVPVYGCGFVENYGGGMKLDDLRTYLTKWDPTAHLPHAKMPMLWMTGFDDPVFPISIFDASAKVAAGPITRCYRNHMVHGHGCGWKKPELYVFANSVVKGGTPLPSVARPQLDPATRIVRAKTTGSVIGASLYYTFSKGSWNKGGWENIKCEERDGQWVSVKPLPEGTTAYNVNARDDRQLVVSSEVIFAEPPALGTRRTSWVRAAEESKTPRLSGTPAQRDARLQWFRDAKFGALISFNPSSITGGEIGWSRGGTKPLDVYGEPAGVAEDPKYDNLYKQFNPDKFDAGALVALLQQAGMRYFVYNVGGILRLAVRRSYDGRRLLPGAFPGKCQMGNVG